MVNAYSQKIFQGSKPVFDGRKNLYSRESLPIGKDKVKKLKESCIYFRGMREIWRPVLVKQLIHC